MYLCSVVTSQLYLEITYLFYDYEITLFMLGAYHLAKQRFMQHFCNNMIDLNDLEFQSINNQNIITNYVNRMQYYKHTDSYSLDCNICA